MEKFNFEKYSGSLFPEKSECKFSVMPDIDIHKKNEKEKTMTVKELTELFKCAKSTVLRAIEKLDPVLVPVLKNNQGGYLLNEIQVTAIKLEIEKHHNLGSTDELPKTNLEKEMIIKQAKIYEQEKYNIPKTFAEALRLAADQAEIIDQMKIKAIENAPKIESFEELQRSDKTMSITETSKHFKLHSKLEVFPYLRLHGYLTQYDLPTQKAIDEKILSLRQNRIGDGKFKSQAVVEKSSLEIWRTKLVDKMRK